MKLRNILAALALTSGPALAQDEMVLLLDWFVNPDHGPIIVAQEKGYFAEQDLSVEVIAPADPSDPPKLVAAGQPVFDCRQEMGLLLLSCWRGVDDDEPF